MFGRGFKIRVTGLNEEVDCIATDAWIEETLGIKEGREFTKEEYKAACQAAPRKSDIIAHCVIFNGEGQRVGSIDLNVTDRRNVVFVGLEVEFDWL